MKRACLVASLLLPAWACTPTETDSTASSSSSGAASFRPPSSQAASGGGSGSSGASSRGSSFSLATSTAFSTGSSVMTGSSQPAGSGSGSGSGASGSSRASSTGGTSNASSLPANSSAAGSSGPGSSGPGATSNPGNSSGPANSSSVGMTSSSGGVALPPVRPMGVNLPNLLHGYLGLAPGDASAMRATMDSARAQGFTHARFIATGYWPTDMTTGNGWVANPTAYLAAFDQLVADARARGLRLIPSLLWHFYMFPDVNQQPVQALFTPGTATRQMAEAYITAIVSRYAGDDVILAWEMGNEMNLLADLDVSTCNVCPGNPTPNNCGSLVPVLGTPCQRSTQDNIFSCNSCRGVSTNVEDLGQFAASMAALVHSLDPGKPFSTGHGYPRASAWHLSRSPCPSCDWTADDEAQFESALIQLHPVGVDIISVHHYAEDGRFGSRDNILVNLLNRTQAIASQRGQQLYVGEYGEGRAGSINCGGVENCNGDGENLITRRVVSAMEEAGVALSALWAWEFFQFCPAVPTCYTVQPGDAVVPWLASHQVARGSCSGQGDGAECPAGICAAGRCVPRVLDQQDFEAPGSESGFLHWTNCANGAGENFGRVSGANGRFALELQSGDLLASGCNFPGAYALSPSVGAAPGTMLLHAVGSASGGAFIRVQFFDGSANQVGDAEIVVPAGSTPRAHGRSFVAPAGTASVQLRFEVTNPFSTLTLDELRLDWRP